MNAAKNADAGLPAFQQYQREFTRHIRDPQAHARPSRVVAGRMRVYTEIVYNNLESSLAACFPVAKKTLGVRAWHRLVRSFFRSHQCRSPLFRQIPEEFLRYLQGAHGLPPWLTSLAHYEWMELALVMADVALDMDEVDADGDLLDGQPVFAPALALLSYDYAVQRISPRRKPDRPLAQPVHLLLFRDAVDNVRFIELNAVTARLLGLLQGAAINARAALQTLAAELGAADAQAAIVAFGRQILLDLKAQGAILGTARTG